MTGRSSPMLVEEAASRIANSPLERLPAEVRKAPLIDSIRSDTHFPFPDPLRDPYLSPSTSPAASVQDFACCATAVQYIDSLQS